ncbi:GrpB family protein [Fulvivirgaceae bacterium BMA12]|uniref:GrpB family protein n=1 Tax=Agaribacillus aureus TaxID=3051825 RepID=A0ABT8L0K3_9BACT|nr:GrpB family protein [Fulvivirgaceae bacterium BMA12]
MKIIIEAYKPEWKTAFDQERHLLMDAINVPDISIEHIGSTSVVGLGAKPIIDIMIGIRDFNQDNHHIKAMESLGYNYISKYEDEMPYRRFFTKTSNGKRTHHIHMVQIHTEFWDRHLRFRDHLRENQEARNSYLELKLNLAEKEWADINDYADAKTAFIREIEEKTAKGDN